MVIVGVQMVVVPVVIWLGISGIGSVGAFGHYALITASASSIFGTPAFVRLLNIEQSHALLGVIFSTLLLPISFPILLGLSTGLSISPDLHEYASRLLVFILAPLGVSCLYHWLSKELIGKGDSSNQLCVTTWSSRLVTVALVVFAISVMDGVATAFSENPARMWRLFGLVMGIHLVFFMVGFLTFFRSGKAVALSAAMLSSYRNLGLVVAIYGSFLSSEFLLFVGLWQIPMYLSPLILNLVFQRNQTA